MLAKFAGVAVVLMSSVPVTGCATAGDPAIDEIPDGVLAQSSAVQSLGCTLPAGSARYDGFIGSYFRLGTPADGELASLDILTMANRPQSIAVVGSWDGLVRRGSLYGSEHGTYDAIPDNPAVGALMGLHSTGHDDYYWVIGSHRNSFGNIDKLCLIFSGPEGTQSQPFGLQRLGF